MEVRLHSLIFCNGCYGFYRSVNVNIFVNRPRKKAKDQFKLSDGPVFTGNDYYFGHASTVIGRASMRDLQAAKANLRLRAVLYWNGLAGTTRGIM